MRTESSFTVLPSRPLETVSVGPAKTVIEIGMEVACAPRLSVATAVTVYVPAVIPLQSTLYGAVVAEPIGAPFA